MTPAQQLSNHPKIKFFQTRYNHTVDLAVEKATAHLKSPQQYPLPPANKKSLERALYDVVMTLPEKKQNKFLDAIKSSQTTTTEQRNQKFGDLATIDLHTNKVIAEQVRDLPVMESMKITEAELIIFHEQLFPGKKYHFEGGLGKRKQTRQAAAATSLQFVLDSLTCNKTNDIHKDEISIGAFATDSSGVASNKAPFFVDKFKKKETKALGAKGNLFSFLIDDGSTGGSFPLTFIAGLFIVEADLIHNTAFGNKLAAFFSILGATLTLVGIGMMFVPGIGLPLVIATMIIALGFNILGHYLILPLIDDIGFPVADTLVLDAPPNIGQSFSRTIALTIDRSAAPGFTKGSYTANVRWVAG